MLTYASSHNDGGVAGHHTLRCKRHGPESRTTHFVNGQCSNFHGKTPAQCGLAAGFYPRPAETTFPMIASSMSLKAGAPQAARITMAPSCGAVKGFRDP